MKKYSDDLQLDFKSYDQLRQRLDKALGFDGGAPAPKSKAADTIADTDTSIIDKSVGDDEDLDYFKSLAESN